jgi:hypothetical protein
LTIVRYIVAALLAIVGLIFVGQGLGYIGGSGMSGQPFWAVVGAILVVGGAGLAWTTRRRSAAP